MKTIIQKCQKCEEDTVHDVGKKQATTKAKSYTRRSTSRCRQCGTKEINNSKTGRRIISGTNLYNAQEQKI